MAWRIGIDIGGTFTDVALVDDASGHIGVAKVPTTPSDLTEGVLCALDMAMRRYQVAQRAVTTWLYSLACRWAGQGVTANVLDPGIVKGKMGERFEGPATLNATSCGL